MADHGDHDWEAWWQKRIHTLSHIYDSLLTPIEGLKATQFAPWLRRNGMTRVLLVGNGISLTPHALAHCGLHVVALDISRVATDFAAQRRPTDRELRFFFQLNETGDAGDFLHDYASPGGSVRFLVGDLLDPATEPGRFDVIFAWRVLQGPLRQRLSLAVERLHSRLSPRGMLGVTVQNAPDAWQELCVLWGRLGYAINPSPWPIDARFILNRPGKSGDSFA